MVAGGRCTSRRATRRRRRRRGSRRGRRAGAAAGRGRPGRRSTRRSARGRRPTGSGSSAAGSGRPSIVRGGSSAGAGRSAGGARSATAGSTGTPSDVSATIGWTPAVQRRPDQLGHPGVEDDLAPAAVADMEHPPDEPARPGDDEPAGLDREAVRPAIGRDRLEQARASRGRTAPVAARARRAASTANPPPTSSVSMSGRPPRSSPSTASPRRTASRHASIAPSCEPTWRWTPRGRTAPLLAASRSTVAVSSVSVIPNFEPPAPTASAGLGLGRRPPGSAGGGRRSAAGPPRPRPARRRADLERIRLVGRLDRDPEQRIAVDARPGPRRRDPHRSCRSPRG